MRMSAAASGTLRSPAKIGMNRMLATRFTANGRATRRGRFRRKLPRRVALPFAVNLVANLLFMPVFAGLRSVPLAAADILFVWATLVWCVVAVWPHYKWVAIVQVPYFVWVSVATVLQLSITAMNW